MKMIAMTCPQCKANIDVDTTGNRSFAFCQYCGSKILLDDGTKHIKFSYENVAKVRKIEAEQQDKALQYQQEEKEADMPLTQWVRRKARKNSFFIIYFIAFLGLPIIFFASLMIKHNVKVHQLEQLVVEIQADIDNKDYDKALYKANSLRLADDYSSEETESWDKQREDLINHINVLKAKENGKLKPPMSGSAVKGQNVDDIVNSFKNNGFTNIKTEEIKDIIAGLLKSEGDVEEVKINGTTGYSADDWFDPDAEVVVRYHTSV